MTSKRKYLEELAATVNRLIKAGITDPSYQDIADSHFPDQALGGETVEGIRKRLPKLVELLESVYEHKLCLVSETYYQRFRDKAPADDDEAMKCIPLGVGHRAEGLYFVAKQDDRIYRAWAKAYIGRGVTYVDNRRVAQSVD